MNAHQYFQPLETLLNRLLLKVSKLYKTSRVHKSGIFKTPRNTCVTKMSIHASERGFCFAKMGIHASRCPFLMYKTATFRIYPVKRNNARPNNLMPNDTNLVSIHFLQESMKRL